jgi:hypothetical protein
VSLLCRQMRPRRQPRPTARFDPAVTRPAVDQFARLEQSVGRLNEDLGGLSRSADLLAGRVPRWVAPTLRIGLIVVIAMLAFLVQFA